MKVFSLGKALGVNSLLWPVITWVSFAGLLLYGIWHPNAYSLLGCWIIILALYLSNAFERINKLEERLAEVESRTASTASSSAP